MNRHYHRGKHQVYNKRDQTMIGIKKSHHAVAAGHLKSRQTRECTQLPLEARAQQVALSYLRQARSSSAAFCVEAGTLSPPPPPPPFIASKVARSSSSTETIARGTTPPYSSSSTYPNNDRPLPARYHPTCGM
eukprot:764564-Hanusia_phi.AAC.2